VKYGMLHGVNGDTSVTSRQDIWGQ